ASADGRRFVVTAADTNRTLWRIPIGTGPAGESAASRVAAPTNGGRAPRIAAGYLLFVSSTGDHDTLWRLESGEATRVWSTPRARIIGGAAIAPDGERIAFVVEENGRRRLCLIRSDGSQLEVLPQPADPQGTPAWSPDGQCVAIAAIINGVAVLARVSADGRTCEPLLSRFVADPAWSPNGETIVYSGAEIGTTFQIQAVSADGREQADPNVTLSRGARRVVFLPGQNALVVLRGDMHHQNFAVIDLATGRERALTSFAGHFAIGDFDVSPDGREIVFEREQNNSHVVMIER
ncbi:MAG TPA: DNA-binding protein, partial [Thermoanaerobaculia bacterium]